MFTPKPRAAALLPLALFLILFIGTGLSLTFTQTDMAFYQLSAAVAILPAIAFALLQNSGVAHQDTFSLKVNRFLQGVGDINIITMVVIYLLAGGFASVTSAIGGVTATINFGLSMVPASFVLPGLFIIASFVATAMGTSMGTVAAVAPIAVGVAAQTTISLPLLMGVVVGGAMFGDNLSMISDTTIAATRSQGCELKDKFLMNFRIVLPAALLAVVLFWLTGTTGEVLKIDDYEFIKVVPYLVILLMAILGINVYLVLGSGIILSGAVGMLTMEGYGLLKWSQDIYSGFVGMNEIMILSMFVGGLGELIRINGGIAWLLSIVDKLSARVSSGNTKKAGEYCIALLAALADLCTANNTVAIILTGGLAKELSEKNGVDPRRSASLLDIFSCAMQGIIPYGAQLLLAGSIAKISPLDIAINNWYCFLLVAAALLAITFNFPKVKPRAA